MITTAQSKTKIQKALICIIMMRRRSHTYSLLIIKLRISTWYKVQY